MSLSQKHQKWENYMILIVLNFEIIVAQPVRIFHFDLLIIFRNAELKIARIVSGSSGTSIIATWVFIKIFHILKDSELGKDIK